MGTSLFLNDRSGAQTRALPYLGAIIVAFDNRTNHGRVAKIGETIALILKSAASNNATEDEIAQMLASVAYDVAKYTESPSGASERPAGAGNWGVTASTWASIHDMAENAPLKDLTAAMAVYLSRIDEALS